MKSKVWLTVASATLLLPSFAHAQASAPDVLVCKDGERLVGHLVNSTDSSVVFKSDAAGQVTIDWSKVQELHTSDKFAVVPKGLKVHGSRDASKVPQGTVAATDGQVQVTAAAQTSPAVPVANLEKIVPEAEFESAFRRSNILQGWKGGATVGIAYTNSTQESQSYTGALNLTRSMPDETWLSPRSRSLLQFNEAYGEISQPGTATAKTSILHLGAEQDWYLNPRVFTFAQALIDHNYSQGLDLQQDYGGGFGVVLLKTANQEFDGRVSIDYIKQQFTLASQNKNLIGSTFGEAYTYKMKRGIVFTETGAYIPAWNNTNAYSAIVNANLTFPVYHHFGFTVGGIDNFLNDPPVGFKKNSFTLTMGATYSIQ